MPSFSRPSLFINCAQAVERFVQKALRFTQPYTTKAKLVYKLIGFTRFVPSFWTALTTAAWSHSLLLASGFTHFTHPQLIKTTNLLSN
jgi:hypothetical protein